MIQVFESVLVLCAPMHAVMWPDIVYQSARVLVYVLPMHAVMCPNTVEQNARYDTAVCVIRLMYARCELPNTL